MATAVVTNFPRVAVVDDDEGDADLIRIQVEDFGSEPFLVTPGFDAVDGFVQAIVRSAADAVICDHRLRTRNFASFNGAEAVASLYQAHIPAILVSKYTQAVLDFEIRPYRRCIPVLLPKDSLDPEVIADGLRACQRELTGEMPPSRKPRRTLVRFDAIENNSAIVFVPGWNPNEAVRLPLSLVPLALRLKLAPDFRVYAEVNTDAATSDELYFESFEEAVN